MKTTSAKKSKGWSSAMTESCYTTHPKLSIGGGTITGGSCSRPDRECDYWIALDGYGGGAFAPPWEGKVAISFPIKDHSVPRPAVTKKLVEWIVAELAKGKTFHIGCIAGHGRTGLLLAAIVRVATGEKDAIEWVRDNYCKSAVESTEQVKFLTKHFGIKKAEPSKPFSYGNKNAWPYSGGKAAGAGNSWNCDDSAIVCSPINGYSIFDKTVGKG